MTEGSRHYFPGGNTPKGFFSYYDQILSQEEAHKIFCIKGGPGTGKSTFMKKLGQEFQTEGETVDYLHCSSDPDSLDGILLREKKVAVIDATAPHTMDPKHPGAVDGIINLGDFWEESRIRIHREEIRRSGEKISDLFQRAYDYLASAGSMRKCFLALEDERIQRDSLYKVAATIINEELTHKELSSTPGKVRRLFAAAITPKGFISHIESLLGDCKKIYVFEGNAGTAAAKIMDRFLESARFRGFDGEVWHCPMDPEGLPEHIIIPKLKLAMVSCSKMHPLKEDLLPCPPRIVRLERIMDPAPGDIRKDIAEDSRRKMEDLLKAAIRCLAAAKEEHDR
ncbi:MAG: hypothetical protein E7224_06515, partial [Clostridiales bacterium]|nr:hypothetical protein [Clostridiales bacterium]